MRDRARGLHRIGGSGSINLILDVGWGALDDIVGDCPGDDGLYISMNNCTSSRTTTLHSQTVFQGIVDFRRPKRLCLRLGDGFRGRDWTRSGTDLGGFDGGT